MNHVSTHFHISSLLLSSPFYFPFSLPCLTPLLSFLYFYFPFLTCHLGCGQIPIPTLHQGSKGTPLQRPLQVLGSTPPLAEVKARDRTGGDSSGCPHPPLDMRVPSTQASLDCSSLKSGHLQSQPKPHPPRLLSKHSLKVKRGPATWQWPNRSPKRADVCQNEFPRHQSSHWNMDSDSRLASGGFLHKVRVLIFSWGPYRPGPNFSWVKQKTKNKKLSRQNDCFQHCFLVCLANSHSL